MMGDGMTISAIAAELGINRKTITRWRASLEGFDEAAERVLELARLGTQHALMEIGALVDSWTPGGLVVHESGPQAEVEPAPVEVTQAELEDAGPPGEPEVIGRDGRLVVTRRMPGSRTSPRATDGPYTSKRPPTPPEWLAEMAAIAKDKTQPERLRAVAMGCVSSALFGGPGMRLPIRQSESTPSPSAEAAEREARQRGRDAGVPASVWQEARQNFLGPAPEPSEAAGDREQVEPEISTA
jgi:AcrR family transcriptional regulator